MVRDGGNELLEALWKIDEKSQYKVEVLRCDALNVVARTLSVSRTVTGVKTADFLRPL